MDHNELSEISLYLLKDAVASNASPNVKEFLLSRAEMSYNKGYYLNAIFYQVRALFQAFQDFFLNNARGIKTNEISLAEKLIDLSDWEKTNVARNSLVKTAVKSLARDTPIMKNCIHIENHGLCDFLQNIDDPLEGVCKIQEMCQKLPREWTIIQLCKGQCSETTCSIFPEIDKSDAPIYLTLLRHVRSFEYPEPLCLRLSGPGQKELFEKFACIAIRFRQCTNVDPSKWNSRESKILYWKALSELDEFISVALNDLKAFFFPWIFMFTGLKYSYLSSEYQLRQKNTLSSVDKFCNKQNWKQRERVLFSLIALSLESVTLEEIRGVCRMLTSNKEEQILAEKMLIGLKEAEHNVNECANADPSRYPCILIVDERLDHFFWEELNVNQEFSRVNSLHCLLRLFELHKKGIRNGYFNAEVTEGSCIVNPDRNLPKTENRMSSFFNYWTPHWKMKFSEVPTSDLLFNDFFLTPCYVYAGHGSGLQYISGKNIAKQRIDSVVFLFGCDSSRLHSYGLFSELMGSHLYYHAANCPTLVGTLMPGLDSSMDYIATQILSRWIAPQTKKIIAWNKIDHNHWIKKGEVKVIITDSTPSINTDFQFGSLCKILTRVHQRIEEPKFYNTVLYVCRGLPAWNCNIEKIK